MMQNLRLAMCLRKFPDLIVGHFTNCPEDLRCIRQSKKLFLIAVADYEVFPFCAHFLRTRNMPNFRWLMNKEMDLQVTNEGTTISFS